MTIRENLLWSWNYEHQRVSRNITSNCYSYIFYKQFLEAPHESDHRNQSIDFVYNNLTHAVTLMEFVLLRV